MKSIANTCLMALLLAACATQPPKSLADKLQDKSPEEQREVLRVACLNEADWSKAHVGKKGPHRYRRPAETAETRRLKEMCRKMDDETPRSKGSAELARQCAEEIRSGNANSGMKHICEAMTGYPIKTSK